MKSPQGRMTSSGGKKSWWDRLGKLNLILQLIATLTVVVPLLLNIETWVGQGITAPVPAWTLIVLIVGVVLFGWLVTRWLAIRKNLKIPRSTKSLGLIYFNYNSGNPRTHDWVVSTQPQPEFKSLVDGIYGRVLQIIPKGPYHMDYDVSQDESSATQVNLTLKPGADWFVCFKVRVVSLESSIGRDVWLSAKFSKKDPLYYKDSKDEWKIELPKTILEKDWALLSINLPESVEATFGKEGWEYEKLTRIRLIGDLTIAIIEFFGS